MTTKRELYIYTGGATSEEQERCGFKSRKDLPAWRFQIECIDWSADPFVDPNWRFTLHAWRMMDVYLSEALDEPDTEARRAKAKAALDVALSWCRFENTGGSASAMWTDMATGIRAIRLAFLLGDDFSRYYEMEGQDRDLLTISARKHQEKLLDEKFLAKSNHGIFQIVGLHRLTLVLGGNDRNEVLSYCRRSMMKLFYQQFDEEGVHKEHSPDYHDYALQVFERIGALDVIGDDEKISKVLSRARANVANFCLPDGKFVPFGDSDKGPTPQHLEKYPAEEGLTDLGSSGFQMVRNGHSMIALIGSNNSLYHKHADDLSFVLFEQGLPRIIDGGKFGYFENAKRDYVLSDMAHSVVGLKGEPIGPRATRHYGSCLKPAKRSGNFYSFEGEFRKGNRFDWKRRLEYRPGLSLVVDDTFSGDAEEEFESRLLLAPDAQVDLDGPRAIVRYSDGFTMIARCLDANELELYRGVTQPFLGWWSPSYSVLEPTTLLVASKKAVSSNLRWNLVYL